MEPHDPIRGVQHRYISSSRSSEERHHAPAKKEILDLVSTVEDLAQTLMKEKRKQLSKILKQLAKDVEAHSHNLDQVKQSVQKAQEQIEKSIGRMWSDATPRVEVEMQEAVGSQLEEAKKEIQHQLLQQYDAGDFANTVLNQLKQLSLEAPSPPIAKAPAESRLTAAAPMAGTVNIPNRSKELEALQQLFMQMALENFKKKYGANASISNIGKYSGNLKSLCDRFFKASDWHSAETAYQAVMMALQGGGTKETERKKLESEMPPGFSKENQAMKDFYSLLASSNPLPPGIDPQARGALIQLLGAPPPQDPPTSGLVFAFNNEIQSTLANFRKDWSTNPADIPAMLKRHNDVLSTLVHRYLGMFNSNLGSLIGYFPETISYEGQSFSRKDFIEFVKSQNVFHNIQNFDPTDPTCPTRPIKPPPPSPQPPLANCATITYVNNSGRPDSEIYILVKGINPQTNRECYIYYDQNHNPAYQDVGYSPFTPSENYSVRLTDFSKDAQGHYLIKLPPMISGRIFTSIGGPLSCQITPADPKDPKSIPSVNPPIPQDPNDVNHGTLYGKTEFSITPDDHGNYLLWINPTSVDDYDLPLSLYMKDSTSGVTQSGVTLSNREAMKIIEDILRKAPNSEWAKLIQQAYGNTIRILAPSKAVANDPSIQLLPTNYLANLQKYLKDHSLFIHEDGLNTDYTTSYDATSQRLIFIPKNTSLPKVVVPITAENINAANIFGGTVKILDAAGNLIVPPNKTDGANLLRDFGAALESNTLPTAANADGKYAINNIYFKAATKYAMNDALKAWFGNDQLIDYYSKAIHSLGGLNYGYAYDDELGQDGTIKGNVANTTVLTLNNVGFAPGSSPLDGAVQHLQDWISAHQSLLPAVVPLAQDLINQAKQLLNRQPPGTMADLQKYVQEHYISGKDIYSQFPGLTDGSIDPNFSSNQQFGNLLALIGFGEPGSIAMPKASLMDEARWRLLNFPWETTAAKIVIQNLLSNFSWSASGASMTDLAEYVYTHILNQTVYQGMSKAELQELRDVTTAAVTITNQKETLISIYDKLISWQKNNQNSFPETKMLVDDLIRESDILSKQNGTLLDLQSYIAQKYIVNQNIYRLFPGLTDGSLFPIANILSLASMGSSGLFPVPPANDVDRALWQFANDSWKSSEGRLAAGELVQWIRQMPLTLSMDGLINWAKTNILSNPKYQGMDPTDLAEIKKILSVAPPSPSRTLQDIISKLQEWQKKYINEYVSVNDFVKDLIDKSNQLINQKGSVQDLINYVKSSSDARDLYYLYPGLAGDDTDPESMKNNIFAIIGMTPPKAYPYDRIMWELFSNSYPSGVCSDFRDALFHFIYEKRAFDPSSTLESVRQWVKEKFFGATSWPKYAKNSEPFTVAILQQIERMTGASPSDYWNLWIQPLTTLSAKMDAPSRDLIIRLINQMNIFAKDPTKTMADLISWIKDILIKNAPFQSIYYAFPGITLYDLNQICGIINANLPAGIKEIDVGPPTNMEHFLISLMQLSFTGSDAKKIQQQIKDFILGHSPGLDDIELKIWIREQVFNKDFWTNFPNISPTEAKQIADIFGVTVPIRPEPDPQIKIFFDQINQFLAGRMEDLLAIWPYPSPPPTTVEGWAARIQFAKMQLGKLQIAIHQCETGKMAWAVLAKMYSFPASIAPSQYQEFSHRMFAQLQKLTTDPRVGLEIEAAIQVFNDVKKELNQLIQSNGTMEQLHQWAAHYSLPPNFIDPTDVKEFNLLKG